MRQAEQGCGAVTEAIRTEVPLPLEAVVHAGAQEGVLQECDPIEELPANTTPRTFRKGGMTDAGGAGLTDTMMAAVTGNSRDWAHLYGPQRRSESGGHETGEREGAEDEGERARRLV
jgi:hypothetical protein